MISWFRHRNWLIPIPLSLQTAVSLTDHEKPQHWGRLRGFYRKHFGQSAQQHTGYEHQGEKSGPQVYIGNCNSDCTEGSRGYHQHHWSRFGQYRFCTLCQCRTSGFSSKVKNTIFAAGAGFCPFLWLRSSLIALLDNTFKSEEDIRKQLGLVTIGIIPTTESCRKKG